MAFIEGRLVRLRGFRRSDLPQYQEWLENAEVTYFLEMGLKPMSEADLETVYRASAETPTNFVFIVERASDGKAIGTAGIWDVSLSCRRGDFRIILGDPSTYGQGFGAEVTALLTKYAFESLNLETVTLGFNAENTAARRAYEKAGYVYEGTRRQLLYRNGRYYDVDQMSMLRKEYHALQTQ